MAQITTLNGISYSIPDPGDTGWGTDLTSFLTAIAPGVLQKTAGLFAITAPLDFGAGNGISALSYSSRTVNPATTGNIRLAKTDSIVFRNNANSANLALSISGTDALLFNGTPISGGGGSVTNPMTSNLDAGGFLITNLATPVSAQDAATKAYVDGSASPFPAGFRRANLSWISITTVDIENNTGTANQTTVIFPDGTSRSVIEDTSITSKYRRFIITETAEFTSGTENSGLRASLSEASNTWYALYAVKSQINAANFVLVGDTTTPSQTNFATLNGTYGANSWVYLGVIRNGDQSTNLNDICSFIQSGSKTVFTNLITGEDSLWQPFGMMVASGTVVILTWNYSTGIAGAVVPPQFAYGDFNVVDYGILSGAFLFQTAAGFGTYINVSSETGSGISRASAIYQMAPITTGIRYNSTGNTLKGMALTGWIDNVLSSTAVAPTL